MSELGAPHWRPLRQDELDEMAVGEGVSVSHRIEAYRELRLRLTREHAAEMGRLSEQHAKQVHDLVSRLDDANRRYSELLSAKLSNPQPQDGTQHE